MTTTPIYTGPTGPASSGPNKLLIALISVGGVLLLSVVAIVFLIIGQNANGGGNNNADNPTPIVTETPATPVADPTDEPTDDDGQDDGQDGDGGQAPVDNSVKFTAFSAVVEVACDYDAELKAQPQISWQVANATAVYWTPNDRTATKDNGYKVGSTGNQNTMSESKGEGERYEFPCAHEETFDTTITAYGANGQKVSKTVTFRDISWGQGGDDDDE